MISRRVGKFGLITAAALVSGALVGCGGSASPGGGSPSVTTTGGLSTASGSGTAGTSSGSTPQQVQVTINGQTVTGTLPANETIPASGTVATVAPGIPILNGLTLTTKARQEKGAPTVSNGGQGEVDVDGCNTGLTVDSNGDLSGYLFLVPGNHTITAIGPFSIVGGSAFNPTQLTITGSFNFGVVVNPDGVASIPSALSVNLPVNGGTLKNGHFVNVTYPTPDFAGGSGTLILAWPGVTIQKVEVFANGKATYKALTNNTPVPSTGLTSVTFNYTP